ncbi:MAG TPA: DUF1572 family protein [Thermoanaerobaculia bacterium]|jgi:uncharacterized damage-inducible protein DinB|nr:DUF1572 family protein [Thermoanaerobaculia bacterium]
MRTIVGSIEAEYRRYKKYAEGAMRQLNDDQLAEAPADSNSVATIVWHIAGNLKSRFTDFLTSDGEKPWRDRESEFLQRRVTHAEMLARWESGWQTLFDALRDLDDGQLARDVTIRGVPLSVLEALHRSLAHTAFHVGQIVFLAKSLRGTQWEFLTIPPKV